MCYFVCCRAICRGILYALTQYNSPMKATLKNVAAALCLLAMVIVVLTAIDRSVSVSATADNTRIRVAVVDLDNNPVHNAKVTVAGQSFFTDDKGLSPAVEIAKLTNSYDAGIDAWGTVTVVVEKEGYAPAIAVNCVGSLNQTRKFTVKLYDKDGSELPYVTYVESPPDEYLQTLLTN